MAAPNTPTKITHSQQSPFKAPNQKREYEKCAKKKCAEQSKKLRTLVLPDQSVFSPVKETTSTTNTTVSSFDFDTSNITRLNTPEKQSQPVEKAHKQCKKNFVRTAQPTSPSDPRQADPRPRVNSIYVLANLLNPESDEAVEASSSAESDF
jgi:hypothetical protein